MPTLRQLRLLRLQAQHLYRSPATSSAELVKTMVAVQAQELDSARLALGIRASGFTVDDVRRAREDERSIVLTWTLRGTLHLVASADLAWMLTFFGPLFVGKTERRYRQLDLDPAIRMKAVPIMRDVLMQRGPLPRAALAEALAPHGIPVAGQAIYHLVRYAALQGVVCYGPQQDGDLMLVALDNWLPELPRRQEYDVLTELARRYLGAYGPATPRDLAAWAGISIKQAQAGFEALADELVTVDVDETTLWLPARLMAWLDGLPVDRHVKLLPGYDPYLLGYEKRDFMVDAAHAQQIHPGGGTIRPTVIVDGHAVATWTPQPSRTAMRQIVVRPFGLLDGGVVSALHDEAARLATFLGHPVEVQLAAP